MSESNGTTLELVKRMERSLLGGLLRWPRSINDVLLVLDADQFYDVAHREVYSAMATLSDEGKPVDLETLADLLYRRGQIDNIGGYAYLAKLWDEVATGGTVFYHAHKVRDYALLRELGYAGNQIVAEAQSPTGTADEALEAAERSIFAIGEKSVALNSVPLAQAVNEACQRIDARQERDGTTAGIPTGFLDLDAIVCGLQKSALILVAARPSVGKTALALAVVCNVLLNQRVAILFVSLEQSRIELAERLLCCHAGVDSQKLRKGWASGEELNRIDEARDVLRGLPLTIDDTPVQTVMRINANARRLKRRQGIGLVVLDYLQLIEPDNRKDAQHEQLAKISRRLKLMARELEVPVLCLAQLNREVEHRTSGRPKLADLRGSGDLEQNADTVILMHRSKDMPNVVELLIEKQRNGPLGEAYVYFNREHQRLENYQPQEPTFS
jgi:replicative DNA helicase